MLVYPVLVSGIGKGPMPSTFRERLPLVVLSFGHFVIDIQISALVVLIPILHTSLHLDYAAAAVIVTVQSLASSLIQPIFGMIGDRFNLRWLLPIACVLAGLGNALVLAMPSYSLVLAVVVISGLGSAAYHPIGSQNANYISGSGNATGISFFFVGGNLGYAVGPLLTVALLSWFGTTGGYLIMIPGILGGLAVWAMLPILTRAEQRRLPAKVAPGMGAGAQRPNDRKKMAMLLALILGIISVRSMVQSGISTFVPLYFNSLPGDNHSYAALLLSIFTLTGAVGTLVGGPLADKIGRKIVMVASLSVVTPLLLLFMNGSRPVQLVTLGLAGASLILASSLTVVMAQEALPNNVGLASGMTLGLGFGMGGIGAALLGSVGDTYGLGTTMSVLTLLPIPLLLLSFLTPGRLRGRAPQPIVAGGMPDHHPG
jgi:MFS transporter, FSR family, fosmidomycin resistance protein